MFYFLPLPIMTHRSISLLILGALVFATAPLASAQSIESADTLGPQQFQGQRGRRAFGQFRRGIRNFRQNVSEEARAAIKACREHDTQEERRACFDTVKEEHDLPNVGRRARKARRAFANIPEEAREALKACRESDDRKACAQSVKEQYNIELPNRRGHGRRHQFLKNLSDEAKDALKACRESDDRKACAQQVADEHGFELPNKSQLRRNTRRLFQSLPEEGKTALRACRESSDSRQEFIQCARNVHQQYSEES